MEAYRKSLDNEAVGLMSVDAFGLWHSYRIKGQEGVVFVIWSQKPAHGLTFVTVVDVRQDSVTA